MGLNVVLRSFHPALFACLAAGSLWGCDSDDSHDHPDPSGSTQPIAIGEARGLPSDAEVTVEGAISVLPGIFNSSTGDQGFAIQDKTGGIYVSIADPLTAVTGDWVRVTGQLKQVAQQTVLASDKDAVELLGERGAVATIDAATGDIDEPLEGHLVRVTGAVTKPVVDDSPYGFKVFIDDGSGELQIFVHLVGGEPLADVASLAVDQTVAVTGFVGQYEQTYEVMPRSADELAPLP
jgi:DNA/RNA endonuclease YhcR with UshA esterase domain